MVQETNK